MHVGLLFGIGAALDDDEGRVGGVEVSETEFGALHGERHNPLRPDASFGVDPGQHPRRPFSRGRKQWRALFEDPDNGQARRGARAWEVGGGGSARLEAGRGVERRPKTIPKARTTKNTTILGAQDCRMSKFPSATAGSLRSNASDLC